MRGLTRRWLLRTPHGSGPSPESPLFQRLLQARGLTEDDQIRRFCQPKLTDLHDPHLMPNLDAAAQRLAGAVRAGESIALYGDYDVDGIAACAILFHVIKAVAPQAALRIYVPHRLEEGYGLNADALRQLRREGADLVVSLDCGITAVEPARAAREAGLDLIITDHHMPDPEGPIPEEVAVVHPRLPGSRYPFGGLCGAGVAFKLAWAFATTWCGSRRVGRALQKVLLDMLPLAALGTIADVVPLVDENRTIATFGLRWIGQTPVVGLRALIESSDLTGAIDAEKVGFVLGPRLNACGRLGSAEDAVRLLTTAEPAEARTIARRLAELNRQRQETQRAVTRHAIQLAEDSGMTADDHRAIVLADESWHAGVLGIVCSRLVEEYGRPVVLLHRQGEVCKGSARSIDGYSIIEALAATRRHLGGFGGHAAAAGLTLRTERLGPFTEALVEHANARITVEELTPALMIDCDATLRELEIETVRKIDTLSPFGRANPRPAVRLRQVVLAEPPRQIGAQGRHLALRLRDDAPAGRRWLRAVWWRAGGRAADLAAGMRLDAVIEPKINVWGGLTSVEGELLDVRACSD